jgi:hypothetical protein
MKGHVAVFFVAISERVWARGRRVGGLLCTFCPIGVAQKAASMPALLGCGARATD